MPKLFFSLLFLCLLLDVAAQDVRIAGRVLDNETGQPISHAQVYSKNMHCGTATNANGEFTLTIPGSPDDELAISALPYESTAIKVGQHDDVDILLRRMEITQTSQLDDDQANSILEGALENISQNYFTTNYTATSFHREYVTHFNSIIQSFESIIKSTSSNGRCRDEITDAVYSEDKRHRASIYNPASGGFYTFGWAPLPGNGKPSSEYFLGTHLKATTDLRKYYNFEIPGIVRDGVAAMYVIHFDQKENIKGALLKGTMYVDSATLAMVKIEYALSPRGIQHILPNRSIGGIRICKPPQKIEILGECGELNFRKFGNRWYLANETVNTTFNASLDSVDGASNQKQFLKIHYERVVTKIDTTISPTGDPAVASLITRNYVKNHFENYERSKTEWPERNILKSDTSMHDVVMTLRMNNMLWERNEGRRAKEKLEASTHFTRDQLVADLEYMEKMFLALHPSLRDPVQKSHFSRMIGNTERQLTCALSETEFSRHLSSVVESLHCGHTQLNPSDATVEYNRKFGKYFPFDIVVIGRRAFLSKDVADTARGSEITKVNGTLFSSILQNLRYKVSTEGLSTATKDHQLGKNFAALYATHYLQPDSFQIELKDPLMKGVKERTFAARHFPVTQEDALEPVTVLDSILAVSLRVPGIVSNDEMEAYLSQVIPLINQNQYSNLVIDLRDNETFKDSFGSLLYSAITADPFTYYSSIELNTADASLMRSLYVEKSTLPEAVPSFLASIVNTDSMVTFTGHNNLKKYPGNPGAYHGNIFILVNGGTNSAATEFAKFVQFRKRGQVVGQEIRSGSHGTCDAGQVSIVLPESRIRITLPLASYHAEGKSDDDSTLIPDHIVQYTITDIVEKRDKEMELCRDLISASCCTAKSN